MPQLDLVGEHAAVGAVSVWDPQRDQDPPPETSWSCLLTVVITALAVATVVALWLAWTPSSP